MNKYKLMFVCTGNICRSPLAHCVFEDIIHKRQCSEQFHVESSGIGAGWHVGENADPRMKKVAKEQGLTLDHIVRHLEIQDFMGYDLLLGMDLGHVRHMESMQKKVPSRARVKLFRDYDPEGSGNVPDPYYGSNSGFEEVFAIISRTSEVLLEKLLAELS